MCVCVCMFVAAHSHFVRVLGGDWRARRDRERYSPHPTTTTHVYAIYCVTDGCPPLPPLCTRTLTYATHTPRPFPLIDSHAHMLYITSRRLVLFYSPSPKRICRVSRVASAQFVIFPVYSEFHPLTTGVNHQIACVSYIPYTLAASMQRPVQMTRCDTQTSMMHSQS